MVVLMFSMLDEISNSNPYSSINEKNNSMELNLLEIAKPINV